MSFATAYRCLLSGYSEIILALLMNLPKKESLVSYRFGFISGILKFTFFTIPFPT